MNESELIRVVEQAGTPRILVLGDLLLDRYVWGHVERISPEAPIPVVRAVRENARVGGAGNAAANLTALGAEVLVWGVVGDDRDGELVTRFLADAGIDVTGIARDPDRPTTVKTRVMGLTQLRHPQQLVRIDREDTNPIGDALTAAAAAFVEQHAAQADFIVVSDYAKGTLPPSALAAVFETARKAGARTLVDPGRGRPIADYRGAAILKPNRFEAALETGMTLGSDADVLVAADRLVREIDLDAAIITLDKEGMVLAESGAEPRLIPTRPRTVYDGTGAGDMVTAAVAWALAGGATCEQAIELANVAAGLEVERLGVVPIARDEVLTELFREQSAAAEKLRSLPELLTALEPRRRAGQRIVWTNGCFDIIHSGHVEYLRFAKRQGDVLVVGLNSDDSVRRNKGPKRPIRTETERARVLSGFESVDFIVIFDDDTPLEYIKQAHPDVLVKGEDWRDKGVVGREEVEAYGGAVVLAPILEGHSTTGTVERILDAYGVNGTGGGEGEASS